MNNEELDLINKAVWWIPFKNKRNNLRNKLIDIIDDKTKNKYSDEILCYPLNWLKYIDSDNFLVKLKNLIKDLDDDSIETVLYFLNRIIKFYRKSDNRLKYMNSKEIIDNKFMIEKTNMVLDFEDYQYYNGMKLTNKINMSYKAGQNFSNIHSYELLFNKCMKDIDISDKNILDIGACYGDTSIFLATKTNKIVYAFEPVKKTYNFLLKTIELNQNKNIIPFNLGISNHIGNSQIYIPTYEGYNDLTSASISNTFNKKDIVVENISLTTVDNFVEEKNIRVGFIKVDIEGEEQKFLEGAKRTIIKQRPYMVISIYHNESDFFDIKPIIESYNADYGFRIVKMIPYVGAYEIVLFCYPKNNKVKAKQSKACLMFEYAYNKKAA